MPGAQFAAAAGDVRRGSRAADQRAVPGAPRRPVRRARRPAHAGGIADADCGGGHGRRLRGRHRAGEPVLGSRTGPAAFLVPAAGRRGLGYRRSHPQGALAAGQRPQPDPAVRRGDAAAARARRNPRPAARAAAAVAAAAPSVPQPARRDDRPGPLAPAHDRGPGAQDGGRARGRARRDAGEGDRPPRCAEGGARLRLRDRGELLALVRHADVRRAEPAVEPALRRRRARQLLEPRAGGRGQRSRLRALPPQPHGLPAAVLRGLPQGLRRPAHRRRHQPEHAGRGLVPAPRRRVLPAPQLRRQPGLFGRVHEVPEPDDGPRSLDRVLHRGWPQSHGPAAAAEDRHAGDDRAQLPARPGTADRVRPHLLRLRAARRRPHLHRRTLGPAEGEGEHPQPVEDDPGAAQPLRQGLRELRRAAAARPADPEARAAVGTRAVRVRRPARMAQSAGPRTGHRHHDAHQCRRVRHADQPDRARAARDATAEHGRGRSRAAARAVRVADAPGALFAAGSGSRTSTAPR